MKIIGLAGRPGSGKSAVADALASRPNVAWIDLDRVAWETYAPGTETFDLVVGRFGEGVVTEDGEIDRGELAVAVFIDPDAREDLEAIVHPAVAERLVALCEEHRERGTKVVLVEGALLTTSRHVDRSIFDAVIWLDVPDFVREERLRAAGRLDHAGRGDDLAPDDSAILIEAQGSLSEVSTCVWKRIAEL
ncbi:MAG: dephospho-CoA kinase [Candidatus Bipolaricaulia bacterium]